MPLDPRRVRRGLPWCAALLGVAIAAPALARGLKIDDLIHREMFVGAKAYDGFASALLGLFAFLTPDNVPEWKQAGMLPWWTDDGIRIAFLRPLSALTHWLDYRLWPGSPFAMHLHSLAWYGAACALAAALYLRFLPSLRCAALAAFFFAVDEGHAMPAEWLANRNALIAFTFGAATLLLHDAWRRGPAGSASGASAAAPRARRRCAWAAAACFALSLGAAEAGVATAAFLAAHAVFVERGLLRARLAALLPYLALGALWLLGYGALGYGARNTGLYVDPGADPARFAAAVWERGPAMLLNAFGGPEPFLLVIADEPLARLLRLLALIGLGVVLLALAPLLARERTVRFLVLAATLAVVPSCSVSLPSGRLVLFAGLAGSAAAAWLVEELLAHRYLPERALARRAATVVAVLLVLANGVLAPLGFLAMVAGEDRYQAEVEKRADVGPLPGEGDVILVNAPSPFDALYAPLLNEGWGERRLLVLAPGYQPVRVLRSGSHELDVRPAAGFAPDRAAFQALAPPPVSLAQFLRELDHTFVPTATSAGASTTLGDVRIEVLEVGPDGALLGARMHFAAPLEELAAHWRAWSWDTRRFEPFAPPAVGEAVLLEGPFPAATLARDDGAPASPR